MTHIIMSGPIKPLTEVEIAFARSKHQQIRACTPRVPPSQEYVVIDGNQYVSLKEAMRLTGFSYAHVWCKGRCGDWRMEAFPGFPSKRVVRLCDLFEGR
jgi:hypothetical protein